MLTEKSINDFNTKKAEFYDENGFLVADESNKHKLASPKPIETDTKEQE